MIEDLKAELGGLSSQYQSNIDSVKELTNFDELILQLAITQLRNLGTELDGNVGIVYVQRIQSTKSALESVKTNGSLALSYQKMYNQCLVLLMSYFSSAIKELIATFLNAGIRYDLFESLRKIEFKLSLSELQKISSGDRTLLTDFILSGQGVSFQDMNSIKRLVKDYFNFEISRDQTVDNLIAALGCRHSVVHSAAIVEAQLMKQIRDCRPQTLKLPINLGSTISFNKEELELVSNEAKAYYDKLATGLLEVFERKHSEVPTG